MLNRAKHSLVTAVGLGCLLSSLGCSGPSVLSESDEPTLLIEQGGQGWQRRWGDSPVGVNGRYEWLDENLPATDWQDAPTTFARVSRAEPTYLWMRVRLPSGTWQTPAIHFASLFTGAEVYLDGEPLGVLGSMIARRDREYRHTDWNVVALPADAPGKWLYLRMLSFDHVLAGVSPNRLWFGDYDTLVRKAVHHQLDQFVLGASLVLMGLFALLLSAKRRDRLYGSFGLFVTAAGGFLLLVNSASRYFLDFLPLRVYGGSAAFLLIPVGLFMYYETIAPDYGRIARTLWRLHAGFAVIALLSDIAGLIPIRVSQSLLVGVLPIELLLLLILSVKSARRGDHNARILILGFAALGLGGLHDSFMSFGLIPDWRHLLAWGVVSFVATLGYLVERRFNHNLMALAEANVTLEQRVEERTRDLHGKNSELEQTLVALQRAQQQLIMQEKMASLGNLVAGVAHEINTPVGAVASSANTSARSLAMMREILSNDDSTAPVQDDPSFRKALRILNDNQGVIESASQRINTIVRSLKNFARLDGSELMEVDLHEGLESTLALVRHELADRIEVVRLYGELPRIQCYPSRLNQVFMNLLVNAAQAIEGTGTIQIRTGLDSGEVFVEVRDDGCGITDETQKQIFDPGFTTKGVGVGTGLGLAISYQIIRDHRGRIDVESEPGKGTLFRLVLPRRAKQTSGAATTV